MNHTTHENHTHIHGANCGHPAVPHGDHTDYLHDGHMHSPHGDHYDEHVIEVTAMNPADCAPTACDCGHDGCGHAVAPHGDHLDYVSDGRLHHRHGDHCDDHGALA
jgi:hypothetical protein